jgi:hypothetical protein
MTDGLAKGGALGDVLGRRDGPAECEALGDELAALGEAL